MENTTYEFFIRRCWHCKRYQKGADADIWNGLMQSHWEYKNAVEREREKLERIYLKDLNEVKMYLDKAYDKFLLVAGKKKLEQPVMDQILEHRLTVNGSLDPEQIHSVLLSSLNIMNQHDLCPFPI